jgi:hypothetical protein
MVRGIDVARNGATQQISSAHAQPPPNPAYPSYHHEFSVPQPLNPFHLAPNFQIQYASHEVLPSTQASPPVSIQSTPPYFESSAFQQPRHPPQSFSHSPQIPPVDPPTLQMPMPRHVPEQTSRNRTPRAGNRSQRPGRRGANLCTRCRRMKHGSRVIPLSSQF